MIILAWLTFAACLFIGFLINLTLAFWLCRRNLGMTLKDFAVKSVIGTLGFMLLSPIIYLPVMMDFSEVAFIISLAITIPVGAWWVAWVYGFDEVFTAAGIILIVLAPPMLAMLVKQDAMKEVLAWISP